MSFCGCNVFLQEYRGFGKSEGTPMEDEICEDAECTLEYLFTRGDIDTSRIVLFGVSLGGAVTIDLAYRLSKERKEHPGRAKRLPILGAIVENTFTSIPDMSLLCPHTLHTFQPCVIVTFTIIFIRLRNLRMISMFFFSLAVLIR